MEKNKEEKTYEEYKELELKKDEENLVDSSMAENESEENYVPSEEELKKLVETYNEQNKGISYIAEGKPTSEEVKEVADEYKEKVEEFNSKTFVIADKDNALRVAKFLKKWNENDVCWSSTGWKGTILFDSWIKTFIEDCQKEPKELAIDWGTLTYLYIYMSEIHGVGLKSAIRFNEIEEEYSKILEVVSSEFDKHNEEGKKIQKLQERWRSYEGGFRLHYVEDDKQ